MNILVTGGCGYTGSVLTRSLLTDGHRVTVIDAQWFGNRLDDHPNLQVLKADTRDAEAIPLDNVDSVVHLANIANDPSVELDPQLSWEVNVLATQRLADRAVRAGVGQFIFASSGSVYGVKDEPKVTEDLELMPISTYNKTKMVAERVLMSYRDHMQVHLIRPATVCGLSPRMRFDVSVNMFTKQGALDQRMTVFGGDQVRPNIHIEDLVNVYRHFLSRPDLESGAYNAGFENISILSIAEMVRVRTGADIVVTPSNDPRSYRQDSSKLQATGFQPSKSVSTAIDELLEAIGSGDVVDRDEWYTVRWMKRLMADGGN